MQLPTRSPPLGYRMLKNFSFAAFTLLLALYLGRVAWFHLPKNWNQAKSTAIKARDIAQSSAINSNAKANPLQLNLLELGKGIIPMPLNTPAAHASSLYAMPATSQASLLAFWFAGTVESAPDVRISFSWFDRRLQEWQPARFVVDRNTMSKRVGFGIRRIGNPTAWVDVDGRVHLFVVATGLGGWAAGRILHLREQTAIGGLSLTQGGAPSDLRFESLGLLPLSWLWNTSHLVRTAPLPLSDGGMVLPVYFELGKKYPVALHFTPKGEFAGMQRMSARTDTLQPSLVALTPTHWLAYLRNHGKDKRVALVQTTDAGEHWQDMPDLPLVNPDASIATMVLHPHSNQTSIVMAYNPGMAGRETLMLTMSADGTHWTDVQKLATGERGSEFSYPAMAVADGDLWVSYTDQRKRIAWQRFKMLGETAP